MILGTIGAVLLLDLLLSGDNMLVIGVAAAGLEPKQRWYAMAIGGLVGMLLRILFTVFASVLLNIPFIQTGGALVLVYLAQKLLKDQAQNGTGSASQEDEQGEGEDTRKQFPFVQSTFLSALLTILIADVTMSLDNILAVGAFARGEILSLIIGLVGSLIMLWLGSALISMLVTRLKWLIDLAALVLAWTSATMLQDDLLRLRHQFAFLALVDQPTLPFHLSWLLLVLVGVTCSIVGFTKIRLWRQIHDRTE